MPPVRIDQKQVWIGDEPHALLSGEMHYWRLSPHRWRDALRRVRDLGLEVAATYVCWEYHELAEGHFDFRGESEPARDLAGFLDMVAKEGLWLLIRPGPYIYSEWVNGGVPDRAARYHRLHPEFQRAAATYMAAVVDVIRLYLATQGGPIILLQAENEPDPWPHIYEAQLGLGREPGPFQDFLRRRYGEIGALNAAWETQLADFSQARAMTHPALRERGYLNRYLDFCRFRHEYTAEVVRWTVNTYRALGVDVPVYVNVYVNNDIQNWREIEAACDLAGPDFYPTHEFRGDPDEHGQFMHCLRYTRTYSALPYIPEFEAGIWQGGQEYTGVLTPNHYLLTCCSALLAGAAGWNWYMLVSRDNWLWSPINEWGRARPDLYQTFEQIVRLFRALDPPTLEKLTATAVTVDPLHRTARLADGSGVLLQSLYQADIDYECFDVETGHIARPLLFYAGGNWLSRAGQERLLDYVEAGGNLVFFQELPLLDDTFLPLNRLSLRQPESVLSAAYPQQIGLSLGRQDIEKVVFSSPSFFSYEAVPGEPILAERAPDAIPSAELQLHLSLPVGAQYVVGYRQRRGEGSVICLGVTPTPSLLSAIHRWLDVPIYSQARSPHVHTALFRRGEGYVLFAVNTGDEDRDVAVRITAVLFEGGVWTAEDLITGEISRVNLREGGHLWLHLPRKSGTAVRITESV